MEVRMLTKDKKTLFALMLKHFGMDDAKVKKILVDAKVPMPFAVEHWDTYIKTLTGRASCVYCGSPVKIDFDATNFYKVGDGLVCLEGGKSHYYMKATERLMIAKYIGDGEEEEAAMKHARAVCLTICTHDNLRFSCPICIHEIYVANRDADGLSHLAGG
jgi:hypothetical protein